MTESWSTDPAENAAVTALGEVVQAMAALLRGVEDTQHINPSGGFVLG
ncbi:hypothetical protein [Nocardia sp. NBC_01388]